MKRLTILSSLLLLLFNNIWSQELNTTVIINSDKIVTGNKQIYTAMQKDIQEFLNLRHWTDLQYQALERIDCSFVITINEQVNDNNFKADIQIQARRTVFNSTYYTPLFSFKDNNFNFEYQQLNPLEYTEGTFTSNLTAMLAYYAYVVIGFDCDSYAKFGGTPYFTKAEAIVSLAQSQSESGWKAFEDDKNRYALINNLLDDNLRKLREFYYEYHRLGLDEMPNSAAKGSAIIATSLQNLREVNRAKPSCIALSSLINTKRDEIINIFLKASKKEKTEVYNLMMDIDPSQSEKYEPILKN